MDQTTQLKEHEWKCYPITIDKKLAKKLFYEKYKVKPLTAIVWGKWLYVGPVPKGVDKIEKI